MGFLKLADTKTVRRTVDFQNIHFVPDALNQGVSRTLSFEGVEDSTFMLEGNAA